jgi:hypothetical protein
MFTTDGICFAEIPTVLILEFVVIVMTQKENLATYCDIEKSPLRNTYPRRDRVWEPAGRSQCQMQQIPCFHKELTTREAVSLCNWSPTPTS